MDWVDGWEPVFHHPVDGATCKALLDAAESARARTPASPARFHDVRYDALVSDPIATIAGIYDHFGLSLTAEAERRMREYAAAKPKGPDPLAAEILSIDNPLDSGKGSPAG